MLVASTDGVGTKLVVARATGRYDTVGIDLVAMCVDDLVCVGAEPLFLLDYIATGRVDPDRVATVVAGVHEGCRQAGCALIGGETAEHPGVMAPDELDLAGFAVGVVERATQLGAARVRAGDVVVGLPSPGLRSNGYTLARHVLLERAGLDLGRPRVGGRRPQPGRRAVAALGDLRAGGAGAARPRWAAGCTPAPTSPAAGSWATSPGCCPRVSALCCDRSAWEEPRIFARDPAAGRGGRGRDGPGVQPRHRHGTGGCPGPSTPRCACSERGWPARRLIGEVVEGGRGALRVTRRQRLTGDGAVTAPSCAATCWSTRSSRGDFTLKSGRKSSWFIDSKQTVCRPEAMLPVADAVLSVIPPEATAIGGLTMGADPVAFVTAGVAATRGRPLKAFSVRKEAKDHGGGGRIAGALDPGDKVVVTEDTVTRGTSLLEAAHAVREAGGEVVLLVAVVDRGGTVEAMAAAEGLPFRAILTAPDLGFPYEGA